MASGRRRRERIKPCWAKPHAIWKRQCKEASPARRNRRTRSNKEIVLDKPSSPPLRGLLVAQFFAAFNNNALKLMVALLAIRGLAGGLSPTSPEFEALSQQQTTAAFVAFTLPLCVF